jgi:predicted CXXCH cytochrome family protein
VLNPGEVPSYDVHFGPLTKRYCVSCHRAGKQNNNYLLTSYDEMLTTGDNAPVVTAGDPQSAAVYRRQIISYGRCSVFMSGVKTVIWILSGQQCD